MPKIEQVDDYESSTRYCPCGSSITWSGFSDDLDSWMKAHAPHAEGFKASTSQDGRRAYADVQKDAFNPSGCSAHGRIACGTCLVLGGAS